MQINNKFCKLLQKNIKKLGILYIKQELLSSSSKRYLFIYYIVYCKILSSR